MSLVHIFRTKPLRVIRAEENSQDLPRSLSLFDLLCIGVGGTVGSGIFATTGDIISQTAGPAAVISWAIAGVICVINAFAYMELVTRVPSSGSTYAYAYHTLGELPAVIAAWLLTLEYAMSGAGVARSWAGKMEDWLNEDYPNHDFTWLNKKHTNFLAALIMALSVGVLLVGVRFGKFFVNTITVIKLAIVAFIIVAGFAYMDWDNLSPFVPSRDQEAKAFGAQGIITGASAAFFGYVGFDEVCCLAAEAKNPKTVMPIAVISVVLLTMALSCLSSFVLSGMIEYKDAINFSAGFRNQGAEWAAKIVHAGETATMPVVVLIAFLAQPRLNYALACDGLMPQIFAKVDEKGNLFVNTMLTGILFIIISFVVPFDTLWDIVNFGIFLNFVMTNSSLLVARTRKASPKKAPIAIATLVGCAVIAAFVYQRGYNSVEKDDRSTAVLVVAILFLAGSIISCFYIALYCPQEDLEADVYRAPLVPFLPTIAILADFYMMAQLSALGLELSLAWIGAAIISYFVYGYGNSAGRTGWSALLHYLPHLSASHDHHDSESFSAPMLEASSMLSPQGKAKQLERELSTQLPPLVFRTQRNNSVASSCSSLTGSSSAVPRSRSLVLTDNSVVLQAMPTSGTEVVEVVAEQSWLLTKLTVQLLWALRMSQKWMLMALRLVTFVVLLLPGLLRMVYYWAFDSHVHKNLIYGLNGRNLLDVYSVPSDKIIKPTSEQLAKQRDPAVHSTSTQEAAKLKRPVVVFLSGGAWIIGYKGWGALMGKALASFGIVVVMPDYRNFPQGILTDMVEDATWALQWVFDNVHHFGGDPENVTLIGQSAGAHIAMCTLLEQVEKRMHRFGADAASINVTSPSGYSTCSGFSGNSGLNDAGAVLPHAPTWELRQIRTFIGISGPYNIEDSIETFHRHGFDRSVVDRIMNHRISYFSPALRLFHYSEHARAIELLHDFPSTYLYHGTADVTVTWKSSEQLADAMHSCGLTVEADYFEDKTHTDIIIEDPISGSDDLLLGQIIEVIKKRSPRDANGKTVFQFAEKFTPPRQYYPRVLVKMARAVNPF